MCTSFDAECGTRDHVVWRVEDSPMWSSDGIDQNIMPSLDSDLDDVEFDLQLSH